jgi:hypothetical protein
MGWCVTRSVVVLFIIWDSICVSRPKTKLLVLSMVKNIAFDLIGQEASLFAAPCCLNSFEFR